MRLRKEKTKQETKQNQIRLMEKVQYHKESRENWSTAYFLIVSTLFCTTLFAVPWLFSFSTIKYNLPPGFNNLYIAWIEGEFDELIVRSIKTASKLSFSQPPSEPPSDIILIIDEGKPNFEADSFKPEWQQEDGSNAV